MGDNGECCITVSVALGLQDWRRLQRAVDAVSAARGTRCTMDEFARDAVTAAVEGVETVSNGG